MTMEKINAHQTLAAGWSARVDHVLYLASRSLARGAAIVDRQLGYPPSKLVVGGLVVWAICVACMLDALSALRDIAGAMLAGAR
jgi:hypothetical protein